MYCVTQHDLITEIFKVQLPHQFDTKRGNKMRSVQKRSTNTVHVTLIKY